MGVCGVYTVKCWFTRHSTENYLRIQVPRALCTKYTKTDREICAKQRNRRLNRKKSVKPLDNSVKPCIISIVKRLNRLTSGQLVNRSGRGHRHGAAGRLYSMNLVNWRGGAIAWKNRLLRVSGEIAVYNGQRPSGELVAYKSRLNARKVIFPFSLFASAARLDGLARLLMCSCNGFRIAFPLKNNSRRAKVPGKRFSALLYREQQASMNTLTSVNAWIT